MRTPKEQAIEMRRIIKENRLDLTQDKDIVLKEILNSLQFIHKTGLLFLKYSHTKNFHQNVSRLNHICFMVEVLIEELENE